jgi:hypothetical protein
MFDRHNIIDERELNAGVAKLAALSQRYWRRRPSCGILPSVLWLGNGDAARR